LRKNNKTCTYPNKIHILKKTLNNNKIDILMLKLKKIDLLTKNDKIHNKSGHGYCDYKKQRRMICVEK